MFFIHKLFTVHRAPKPEIRQISSVFTVLEAKFLKSLHKWQRLPSAFYNYSDMLSISSDLKWCLFLTTGFRENIFHFFATPSTGQKNQNKPLTMRVPSHLSLIFNIWVVILDINWEKHKKHHNHMSLQSFLKESKFFLVAAVSRLMYEHWKILPAQSQTLFSALSCVSLRNSLWYSLQIIQVPWSHSTIT